MPVYKQEKTIHDDILAIRDALRILSMQYEIIAVVDGYLDNSLKEIQKIRDSHVKVVGYKSNHGKGYAVRYGFSHASGDVIGFIDAGRDLSPSSLPLMFSQFEFEQADAVIGSKRHPDSNVKYPLYRIIMSWVYQQLVHILFGLNITDSQVGMKIYKRKLLADVLPRLLVKEFAFDIEILAVAYRLGYRKIREAPIRISYNFSASSIRFNKLVSVIFNMVKDTLAVYYRLKILRYYDDDSKRKWKYDPELNFRINIG